MRRFFFSLLAMSFLGMFAGCSTTHGVCDCPCDCGGQCQYNTPWVNDGASVIPEHREMIPTAPKKIN